MSPKTAIIILLTIALLIGAGFFIFYLERQSRENLSGQPQNESGIVPLANEKQLTPEERKQLEIEREVNIKVEEKYQQIEQQASNRSLTQDEVNFILNPRQTVAEELGVNLVNNNQTVQEQHHLSQEEIDAILNPSNNQ